MHIEINESKHTIKYGTGNEMDSAVVQAVKPCGPLTVESRVLSQATP